MKVKNTTNNTLYVQDLDLHITDGDSDLSPESLKRSKCLRSYIISGLLKIESYDPNERIEASLVYLCDQNTSLPSTTTEEPVESTKIAEIPPMELEIPPMELCSVSDDIEVRINGIFFDGGGYAKVNRNLALQLDKAGIKVRIDPKKSQNELRESDLLPLRKLMQTPIGKNHIAIDSIIPSFAEYSNSKYRILYTTIESYTIPKQFLECCDLYNEIWITSPWSLDILKKYTKKPVYLVPAGSDPVHYCENGSKLDFRPNIKDFVFISVFGWSYRKGYDVLLKSYFDEFSAEDNVSLLIVSRYQGGNTRFHRNKIRDDINSIMRNFPNKDLPHVVRYSQIIPESQMPQLYRSAHCFVLPSRGEGSCLPAPEASLCGLPVIMTNVSGQQMYLRDDNAFLIDMDQITEMKTGQMHLHYWDGQKFPSLTSQKVIDQLKEHMRYVFDNYEEAKIKNQNLQKLIKQNFTWTHTANAALDRLKQIYAEIKQ